MRTRKQSDVAVSLERARQLFDYDPESGELRSRVKRGKIRPGDRVGTERPDGRRQVRVDYVLYLEHHIIWLLVSGEWPEDQIDHRDLARANNSQGNLRECSNGPNNSNRRVRRDSISRIKGVRFDARRGRWEANITKDLRRFFLGFFDTAEAASSAYRDAANRLHGEFARHE